MKNKINMKNVKKILVLNMLAETIGDSILLIPLFNVLKRNYPDKYIALTTTEDYKCFFENNKNIDEIIIIKNLKKIGYKHLSKLKKAAIFLKILKDLPSKLRKEKFDLCLVMLPNFAPNQIIPFLSRIKYSIGFNYKNNYFGFLMTKEIPFRTIFNEGCEKMHFIDCYLDILKPLNLQINKKDILTEINVSKKDKEKAREILKKEGVNPSDKFVVFQAGAKWESKKWPWINFAKVAKKLREKNLKIILLGNKDEYRLNEKINNYNNNLLVNLSGKINLSEVVSITSLSDFVICNDSGLAHIASSLGVKTIILRGSTREAHSNPLGKGKVINIFKNNFCYPCNIDKKNCEYDYNCMRIISVEDALDVIKNEIK